jgi:hypothetical protein
MYSGVFAPLNNDKYAPQTFNFAVQSRDNYGIYSFACINTIDRQLPVQFDYRYTFASQTNSVVPHKAIYLPLIGLGYQNKTEHLMFNRLVAWQTYHTRPIPVDFRSYVETYCDLGDIQPIAPGDSNNLYNRHLLHTYSAVKFALRIIRKVYRSDGTIKDASNWFAVNSKYGNYDNLMSNAFVYNTNHEVYQEWFNIIPEYKNVWNNPIYEYLTIVDPANSPDRADYFHTLDSSFNNLLELDIYNYYFQFYGIRKFEIDGEIHELSYTYQQVTTPFGAGYVHPILDKPCYYDLIYNYKLDNRTVPNEITLLSSVNTTVRVGYYRRNPLERYSEKTNVLTTLDYANKLITLKAGIEQKIPIENIVLGTLHLSNSSVQIISTQSNTYYDPKYLKFDTALIAELFSQWMNLYDLEIERQELEYPYFFPKTPNTTNPIASTGKDLKILAAYNNYWQNGNTYSNLDNDPNHTPNHPLFNTDLNPVDIPEHPVFYRDLAYVRISDYRYDPQPETKVYRDYFEPQSNGSFGRLVMDSPRIIEMRDKVDSIFNALDAQKYSTNDVDLALPRVSNLGWHINRQSEILGIRVDANGVIDRQKEKDKYNPQILNNPQYAEGDYGVTCWGKYGMVIPRLITEYDGSGQIRQPYHVVYDLPQIVRAFQGDIDTALSLQHGTEIRTRDIDGKVGKYPNQLALMLDLHRRTQAIELYSQRSYNLNTVSNAEIRGLYGGLGIPVSQQFINATNLVGKTGVNRKLPYFSYQKGQQTIASRFTTVEVNLGIILGTIMPKSQTEKQKILNPFKRFGAAK